MMENHKTLDNLFWISDRLKTALSRIAQDSDPWMKSKSVPSSSTSMNMPLSHMDITPASPPSANFSQVQGTSFGLKVLYFNKAIKFLKFQIGFFLVQVQDYITEQVLIMTIAIVTSNWQFVFFKL